MPSISNNIGPFFSTYCATAGKRLLAALLPTQLDTILILPQLASIPHNPVKPYRDFASSPSKRKVYRHIIGAPIPDLKGAMIAAACALGPKISQTSPA